MSFPLFPIPPQTQDQKLEVALTVADDSEQIPFTIFFGLENQKEDQATLEAFEEEAALEMPVDQLETTDSDTRNDQPFAVSETPMEQPKAHTERQPQTLVESAFFPAANLSSLERSQDIVTLAEMRAVREGRNDTKPSAIVSNRVTLVSTTHPANPAVQLTSPSAAKGQRIEKSARTIPTLTQPQATASVSSQATIFAAQPLSSTVLKTALNGPMELGFVEKLTDIPLVQGQVDIQSGLRSASLDPSHLPPQPQHAAKSVANQMAVAVAQNGGGTTELILSPEELGRVRMIMSTQDGGITVLIQTERPETSDMLRRYIDTLSQEFKNMGYNSTSFEFSQDQEDGSAQRTAPSESMLQDSDTDAQQPATIISLEGLDLRL